MAMHTELQCKYESVQIDLGKKDSQLAELKLERYIISLAASRSVLLHGAEFTQHATVSIHNVFECCFVFSFADASRFLYCSRYRAFYWAFENG